MAHGPQKNDQVEVLVLIGALAGLCFLVAGAVADLSIRTAAELSRIETEDNASR